MTEHTPISVDIEEGEVLQPQTVSEVAQSLRAMAANFELIAQQLERGELAICDNCSSGLHFVFEKDDGSWMVDNEMHFVPVGTKKAH